MKTREKSTKGNIECILASKSKKKRHLLSQQSRLSALDYNTAISLMAHLAALCNSKSRTALVLLHQHLRVAEIAIDRRALAIVANCRVCVILLRP